jgi:hypothetical protein
MKWRIAGESGSVKAPKKGRGIRRLIDGKGHYPRQQADEPFLLKVTIGPIAHPSITERDSQAEPISATTMPSRHPPPKQSFASARSVPKALR